MENFLDAWVFAMEILSVVVILFIMKEFRNGK